MKIIEFVALTAFLAIVVGCGSSEPDAYYPIDGGYINLRTVHTIKSQIGSFGTFWGAISRSNIKKLKSKLRESKSGPSLIGGANLYFDDFKVELTSISDIAVGEPTWKDYDRLYDMWLETMEDLDEKLKDLH